MWKANLSQRAMTKRSGVLVSMFVVIFVTLVGAVSWVLFSGSDNAPVSYVSSISDSAASFRLVNYQPLGTT